MTSDDVLDVAERLVNEQGLHGVSVRRIAEELGVSRQVVYTHFDGMNGVFDRLHLRTGRYLAQEVQALVEPAGSDRRMVEAGLAYCHAARRRPGLFELTFGHPIAGYEPSVEVVEDLRRVFHEHIVTLVQQWCGAHDLEAGSREIVADARIFWSAIHGLVTLERAGHARPDETNQLVEGTVIALLAGWRAILPSGEQRSGPDPS